MYRFHPSVRWRRGYPNREEILEQVQQLWKRYGLEERTRFGVKVGKVFRDVNGRWIVDDISNGFFEGIIAAVGTCGETKMPHLPDMEKFRGTIYHSSELTG